MSSFGFLMNFGPVELMIFGTLAVVVLAVVVVRMIQTATLVTKAVFAGILVCAAIYAFSIAGPVYEEGIDKLRFGRERQGNEMVAMANGLKAGSLLLGVLGGVLIFSKPSQTKQPSAVIPAGGNSALPRSFCPQCGAQNSPQSSFCTGCGSSLQP